ncbi:inactive peptidyl-prolyl cis-trans isomerase FKBP6 isoform X2 [Phymastichus coffea]|uniref:inactive peptidyl-prolyl cis-trans isomerase FKBP6 isoform X2 n=1 Tax=Phymastichus coffea TaxID=108790 RepID=UPI00273BFDF5|nr:inactive peptidyl-prolyl cis-trans isomerase FKBP6 isoform X2 [Phymastichus coffea]
MPTIRVGEGFTVNQILNSDGFTLDTSDFPDLLDEDEQYNHKKTVELSNQEIQRLLNLEDENDSEENVTAENTPFIGIGFDTLKPKMFSIFGNREVLKLIKKEGTGEVIPHDAQVTVEYVGYFEYQDEPFDSTLFQREKRATLRLGKGEMIKGLEIAIASMKKFEKSVFIIQPNLAYGALGCPPRIPADSEVLFKVELIDFLDNGSADKYEELTNEEKRMFPRIEKIVRDLLNTARDSYGREKIKQAVREYNRAVHCLDTASLENDEQEMNMNKLLSRALSNLIICYNHIGKPKLACASFDRLPSKSAKNYYHYGKALKQLGEYDKAMKALQKANNMSPNNEPIHREILEVNKIRKDYQEKAKQFAQKSMKFKDDKPDEFEQFAKEICEDFKNKKDILKEELPFGLIPEEMDCIRRVSASYGFSITKHERYGVEKNYLTKKAYYSRDLI